MSAPNILLIEDRHEQSLLFQLNFTIYLGGNIIKLKKSEDINSLLKGSKERPQLIVIDKEIKNQKILENIEKLDNPPPIIYLTDHPQGNSSSIQLNRDVKIKNILQESAKILSITPKIMAEKSVPRHYPIPIYLFEYLIYYPIETSQRDSQEKLLKLYEQHSTIDKNELDTLKKSGVNFLYIDSYQRLKFANTYTEQITGLAKKIVSTELSTEGRMKLVDETSQMMSKIYHDSEMQAELTTLALSCSKAMLTISESSGSLKELQDFFLKNKMSYRFVHSQLIIYIGLHSLKMMGWWSEENGNYFALAAFYHDIILLSDEEVKINSSFDLNASDMKDEIKERILSHANIAYELLEATPGIHSTIKDIVKEHHCSPSGIDFDNNISSVGDLSKIFILVERWVELLLESTIKKIDFDCQKHKNDLQLNYVDPLAFQIIETLQVIDQDQIDMLYQHITEEAEGQLFASQNNAIDDGEQRSSGATKDESSTGQEVLSFLKENMSDCDLEVLNQFQTLNFYNENITDQDLSPDELDQNEKKIVKNISETIESLKEMVKGTSSQESDSITIFKSMTQKINTIFKVTHKDKSFKKIIKKSNSTNKDGVSELMKLCLFSGPELIEEFMENENDLKKTDKQGRCCIHFAAIGGNYAALEYMIAKGMNKNAADSQRKSPLFYTIINKKMKAFNFLLNKKVRLEQQAMGGVTIGMLAAKLGNLEMLKIIIKRASNIHAKDFKNRTIIDYAKSGKNQEVIDFLEKALK